MNTALTIASLHINSPAKVAFAILGQPHWLMQLQQAVRYRLDYESQLAETEADYEALQEMVAEAEKALQTKMAEAEGDDQVTPRRLRRLELRLRRLEMTRRDTLLLLETAAQLEANIMAQAIAQYPELEHASYEDVQRQFSDVAFEALCAQAYVKDVTARALGVSEGVAEMLMQLSPDQREMVLRQGHGRLTAMGIYPSEPTHKLTAEATDEH